MLFDKSGVEIYWTRIEKSDFSQIFNTELFRVNLEKSEFPNEKGVMLLMMKDWDI